MTAAPPHIAMRLFRARESRGWTLLEAGNAAGVAMATVHAAERGRDMLTSTLIALCRVYGLSLDALVSEPECGRCLDSGPCTQCGGMNGKTITDKEDR